MIPREQMCQVFLAALIDAHSRRQVHQSGAPRRSGKPDPCAPISVHGALAFGPRPPLCPAEAGTRGPGSWNAPHRSCGVSRRAKPRLRIVTTIASSLRETVKMPESAAPLGPDEALGCGRLSDVVVMLVFHPIKTPRCKRGARAPLNHARISRV